MLGFEWYPNWLVSTVAWGATALFVTVVVGHAARPKYRRLFGWKAPAYALMNALLPSVWVQIYLLAATIVLSAPVWWLAVIISRTTGAASATVLFLSAMACFYGLWLVQGLAGHSINRSFDELARSDEQPPEQPKRVAVIGAGMAGLVAAKELREEGHEVVVFERTIGPGGVWASSKARGGQAWGSTMTSSGALNTVFSDSPTKVFHADHAQFPHHLDRQEFLDALLAYESRHGVFERSLRCNSEVESMTRLPEDRWRLGIVDTATGLREVEDFDAVTICTGLNLAAHTPEIEGQDRFVGEQLHAEQYRPTEVERFAGKQVLVIGIGETSSDVVKDLVDNGAEHVVVSQRGPTWVIPRNVGNLPPDHVETRLLHSGPMFHRWAILVSGVVPYGLFNILRPSRLRPPRFRDVLRILVLNHPRKHDLWHLGSLNFTKSDNLYFALETGRASVRRDIDRLTDSGVVFADGRTEEIDAVVYCTGYRPGASLLPAIEDGVGAATGDTAEGWQRPHPQSARDLYKLTIPPDHKNVAFIGFARGQIGAITMSSELQARWWALLVSGKRQLPEPAEMRRHVRSLRHNSRRFHQPTRTTPCFAYSVAGQDIGCEPDLFRLFLTDRRLWFAVLMGPVCTANFRLRGPKAKPEMARAQMLMPQAVQTDDYVDSVDLACNTLPLAALVLPLYSAYCRVLPGFNFQRATRSYS